MPCRDQYQTPAEEYANELQRQTKAEVNRLRNRNNALMRAICEIDQKVLHGRGYETVLSKETLSLLTAHREFDAKRKATKK